MPNLHESLDKSKVKVKAGRFLVDECQEVLQRQGWFFMSGMNSKEAWRLKRSLSKKMNRQVRAYPAYSEEFNPPLHGYEFKLVNGS